MQLFQLSTGLYKDPDGFQELYMDNWYSAKELFVMQKTKYKILSCCMILTNRKGWDQIVMNLSNLSAKRIKDILGPNQWGPLWTMERQQVGFVHLNSSIGGYWYNYTTVWEWKDQIPMTKCTEEIQ